MKQKNIEKTPAVARTIRAIVAGIATSKPSPTGVLDIPMAIMNNIPTRHNEIHGQRLPPLPFTRPLSVPRFLDLALPLFPLPLPPPFRPFFRAEPAAPFVPGFSGVFLTRYVLLNR